MLFYIRPGFAVKSENLGPTLLTPVDGPCKNCKLPVHFSWTPIKNAEKYQFILASDPELKKVVVKADTSSTAFEYKDKLEIGKVYYWQVQATAPVISDSSPVGAFSIIRTEQAPAKETQAKKQSEPVQAPADVFIWIIIIIAAVLLVLINAYAFLSRRRD